MTNQEKVLNYLGDKDLTTLRFNGGPHLRKIEDLDLLVFRVIGCTGKYASINTENKRIETHSNRWRSSIDIWRHVKYYKPEVTIFDVMNSLYNMRNRLRGQYCHLIYRRTFKTSRGGYIYDQERGDEYNLSFDQWKDINK